MNSLAKRLSFYGLGIVAIFVVWLIFCLVVDNQIIFPSPLLVFASLGDLLSSSSFYIAFLGSVLRLVIGVVAAIVTGTILGLLAGLLKNLKHILAPIVTILRVVPVVSIVVIVLIISGLRFTPFVITYLVVFPISYMAMIEGVNNVNKDLIDAFKLESNSVIRAIIFCYFPLSFSYFKLALKSSLAQGTKVLIMSEYLSQTPMSLGNLLFQARMNIQYDKVFALTLILIILVLIPEAVALVVKLINNRKFKGGKVS
jgi:NitT/TauT family transport system permease protein